ncbi:MAG: hypothetical protein ACYC5K_14125, partial [Saccharofermentanales bacterium]
YFSNRNSLKGGDTLGGELRLKNLDTGADISLGEIGYECLGWDMDDNVYYFSFDQDIIAINTNDVSVRTILSDANPHTVLLYPIFVSSKNKTGLDVYNIETKTTRTINNMQFADINVLAENPDGTAVLFENSFYPPGAETQNAPEQNIGIYRFNDGSVRFFDLPGDSEKTFLSWVDDKTVSLTLKKNGSDEAHTYLLDTSLFTSME